MTIQNGQLANADEVLNTIAKAFIGGTPRNSNYSQSETLTFTTLIGTTAGTTYDDFENGSIDTTKWLASGTTTEAGGVLTIGGFNQSGSIVGKENIFSFGTYVIIELTQSLTAGGSVTTSITDGTHTQNLITTSVGATTLILEKIGNTVYYKVGSGAWGNFDSTAFTTFKLSFVCVAGGDVDTIILDLVSYYATPNTFTWTGSAVTCIETMTSCVVHFTTSINGTYPPTVTYYVSADNGSNYEVVTNRNVHRFTSTGTQFKAKVVIVTNSAYQNKEQESTWTKTEALFGAF
jgi:hypothetical protein